VNEGSNNPETYSLEQNYPNPFNPSTSIQFRIPENSFVTLKIYNVLGKEITTLVNEKLNTGKYEIEWNASEYPSGVYFYQLKTNDFAETKKMILVK